MATTKTPSKPAKSTQAKTGAGPALAAHTKDAKPSSSAKKPVAAKPAAKAKSAAAPAKKSAALAKAAAPAKAKSPSKAKAASSPSIATRVMRKVKATAEGAVNMAASVIGKEDKAKAKR